MEHILGSTASPGGGSFTTIDDVILLSQKLSNRLKEMGKYKHPLAVRKGVKAMTNKKESHTVRAGSITYFFDIKRTRDGKTFLMITESRFKSDSKERERKTIIVFQENVHEFVQAVSQISAKLG